MKYRFNRQTICLLLCLVFMISMVTGVFAKVVVSGNGSSIFDAPFMQAEGSTGVMVIPVQFSDTFFVNEDQDLDNIKAIFRDGGYDGMPSMKEYYENASYGQIYMDIIIQRLVELPNPRSYYDGDPDALIWDALTVIYERGVGVGSFDENYDGYLDALYLVCAGGAEDASSPWWPHTVTYYGGYETDECYVGSCSILSYDVLTSASPIRRYSAIHETGHLLGLTDLYATSVASGTGTDTMMDLSVGDLDPFSKLLLGWNEPQVTSQTGSYRINSSSVTGDALMIVPEGWDGNLLSEYFMVEYVTPEANQAGLDIKNTGGVRIWHVDAGTSTFTNDVTMDMYKNSNSSGPKLLSMVDMNKPWYYPGEIVDGSKLVYADGTPTDLQIRIASMDGAAAVIEVTYPSGEAVPEESAVIPEETEETSEETENTEETVEAEESEDDEWAGETAQEAEESDELMGEETKEDPKIFSASVEQMDPSYQVKGDVAIRKLTVGNGITMGLAVLACVLLIRASRRYKNKRRRRR